MTAPVEPQTPTDFPPFLNAGTTLKVDRDFTGYPNTDWSYSLILAGASVLTVNATADANGVTFHVVVTATQSNTLSPGPYQYTERLTAADGEVFDVGNGRIMVNANPANLTAGQALSYEERTLAVIEAALQNRLTSDIEHYSIAGRSVSKIPVQELIKLRGTYAALVWKQRNPGKLMQPVEVYFPPSRATSFPPYWKGDK